MELEGLLPHFQEPATCPYPEPHQSSPCPHSSSRRSILILSSYLRLGLPSGFFSSGFCTKPLYLSFLPLIHATCRACLSLLDLITRMRNTEHKASRCVVDTTILTLCIYFKMVPQTTYCYNYNYLHQQMHYYFFIKHTPRLQQEIIVHLLV
jgi:hypothetical protein